MTSKSTIDFNLYMASQDKISLKDFGEISIELNQIYSLIGKKFISEVENNKLRYLFNKEVEDIQILHIEMGSIKAFLRAYAPAILFTVEIINSTLGIVDNTSSLMESNQSQSTQINNTYNQQHINNTVIIDLQNEYLSSEIITSKEKKAIYDNTEITSLVQEFTTNVNKNSNIKEFKLVFTDDKGNEYVLNIKKQ